MNFLSGISGGYSDLDEIKVAAASKENVPNNATVNEGYEIPIEREYHEIEEKTKNAKYEYIKQQSVAHIQSILTNPTNEPTANQQYETLQYKKASKPSWIKRHKIAFAVIVSVILTALITTAVFVTVLMTTKSTEDSRKYNTLLLYRYYTLTILPIDVTR